MTFCAPSASTARTRRATNRCRRQADDMPRENPTRVISRRMKSTIILRARSVLMSRDFKSTIYALFAIRPSSCRTNSACSSRNSGKRQRARRIASVIEFGKRQRFVELGRDDNRLAIGTDHATAAPKRNAIFHANPVARKSHTSSRFPHTHAKIFTVNALARSCDCALMPYQTGRHVDQEICAIHPFDVCRRKMPRIFADEDTHASEPCIKSAERIAGREKSSVVEQAICRQINFAMHVDDLFARQVCGGKIVTIPLVLFDKTKYQVDVVACGK